ncbi:MAG: hypothetical protein DYG83_13255 [Candidatus Brocadia sp. AMX2]|uniref:Uncharacterized protein n=2 Tax=Candidatus Brocadiaceae TaxID=1127830 RepID=A0ABQ0JYY7_9BACT|nr:MAG: hypothetical protein EDM70_09495 [Candidatus Brocadia sp. AMX2]MBC6932214.1 hypothetical protein [Candidatus Brocadia sp.]MBL1168486.1 hypothetical protein [Candidatus Brocadia sp. AMX1]NUQ57684.1 hypothetical protein [Candidatus Paceibacter sp.]GAN33941.1 hypothetical protein BROSI_A2476 [Candidatus Brocadia sinica JPN1]GIK14210.1 MAG: hypothetical protein BroJett002_29170 [Candidatus Brocadia sinica]
MNLLTEVDPKTGRKTLSPIYQTLRNRKRAGSHKDEPEQKSVITRREVVGRTQKPEPASTITVSQRQALIDLQKYKSGERIDMRCRTPQTAEIPEPVKALSFEEQIISDWKNDSALQREFTSFNNYTSFMKAQREGRTKIHRGCVVK